MSVMTAAGVTPAQIRRGLTRLHPRASQRSGKPAAISSGAPTLTWGASNASTSITGATRRPPWQNPDLRFLHAEMIQSNSATTGYTGCVESKALTSPNQSPRGVVETWTDADALEVFLQCTTSSQLRTRVWVDGQPISWTPDLAAGTGGSGAATYRLKLDWTSAGGRVNRLIRVEWLQGRLLGFVAHPTVGFWKPRHDPGPLVGALGDSFGEGSGGTWWWDSWLMWMARAVGWNIVPVPVGSTGYLANGGGGGKVKYRDRLSDLPPGMDYVILSGGYNDIGTLDVVAEQAEIVALHSAIVSTFNGVGIVQFGPNMPTGVTTTGSATNLRDAIKNAVLATNTARPGTVIGGLPSVGQIVDPIQHPDATSWITGNGRVGATNGSGNADYYTGTDGVHPSAAGHEYLGLRAAAELVALGLA